MYNPTPPPEGASLEDTILWLHAELRQLSEVVAHLEEQIEILQKGS